MGGQAPGPLRTGGGENGSNITLLEHVYRGLARSRGSAYDQSWPPTSPVGVENMAMARAITFDGYGANQRLANNFVPQTMMALGNLGRWERLLALSVLPTDTETTRRTRVAETLARFGQPNSFQRVADACVAIAGPAFVALVPSTPGNATIYWPGGTPNAQYPWYSTIAQVDVVMTYQSPFYLIADGTPNGQPNGAWWALVAQMKSLLDSILPAWATFVIGCYAANGQLGWYLDQHNLDGLNLFAS